MHCAAYKTAGCVLLIWPKKQKLKQFIHKTTVGTIRKNVCCASSWFWHALETYFMSGIKLWTLTVLLAH